MTKILITGSASRAASRVGESLEWKKRNFELETPSHSVVDVTDSEQLEKEIHRVKPDFVVNFAGITDLKTCENQRNNQNGQVWQVNALGAKNLAKLSKTHDFHLLQISTASVFSGREENPGPYLESAEPESDDTKLSWYGLSKLWAERYVQEFSDEWTIVRLSSTVRSSVQSKPCLFRRWLAQSQNGTLPPLFDDELISTSDLTELDQVLIRIIEKKLDGVYHLSSPNLLSPYQIAKELLSKTEIKKASLMEQIQNGNKELELFCPRYWGLNSVNSQKQLEMKFNTIEESITHFLRTDLI